MTYSGIDGAQRCLETPRFSVDGHEVHCNLASKVQKQEQQGGGGGGFVGAPAAAPPPIEDDGDNGSTSDRKSVVLPL